MASFREGVGRDVARNQACSVAGHVPTLPWVRSSVWVRVRLGSWLASGKGWVGTWPVTRLARLRATYLPSPGLGLAFG